MRFLDFLSWAFGTVVPGDSTDHGVTDRACALAEQAECASLTPESLAKPGSRTAEPLLTYLDEDERPQYVFPGSELVISDESESTIRKHPARQLVVGVTDDRIVFVVGGRFSDELFEVPLSSVTMAYIDENRLRRHVVIEADQDGVPMTFFADVTIAPSRDVLTRGVQYVRSA